MRFRLETRGLRPASISALSLGASCLGILGCDPNPDAHDGADSGTDADTDTDMGALEFSPAL